MSPEVLVYVGIPAIIVFAKIVEMRFDRRTKLLVERERAKAMLELRSSQSDDREKSFLQQQQAIANAARKLREQRASQPAPVETSQPPAPQSTDHKVGEEVWNAPTIVATSGDRPAAVAKSTETPKTAPRPVPVEEPIVEDVYTASDEHVDADTDTVH